MRLVEEGKIDLDADISRYLGFPLRNPAYPQRPITMRMLLSHTSSLRDGGLYNLPPPHALRELFVPGGAYYDGGAHFAPPQQGADQGPGAYFTYANLNYGVLGTIVEAVSGERFDRYMQEHVLAPLGIDGGYTIGSLSAGGFAELAAIYSKQSPQGLWDAAGPWYPQLDSYAGVFPHPQPPVGGQPHLGPAPAKVSGSQAAPVDMRRYMPGANATLFAPHAGLRISARDLAKFLLLLLDEGRYGGEQMLARDAVRRMLQEEWRYDPQQANGDTGHGRYRAWGLGLQHTVGAWDELGGDRLAAGEPRQFWGHRGEAYGFLGGMWFDPQSGIGFVYLINGLGDDPYQHWGQYSSAYAWEEAIQTAILDEIARWEAAQQ
jgi:CubicO group peptidase (beta-lactamase class C family)